MEVSLAVLADGANVSREGKLNILGIFDRIYAHQLPGQFPPMQLVIRLEVRPAETRRDHTIQVQLRDPDGDVVFDITGSFTPVPGEPDEAVSLNHIIGLANLPLGKAGNHSVAIWVDNDLKKEVPLKVVPAPAEPAHSGFITPPYPPAVH